MCAASGAEPLSERIGRTLSLAFDGTGRLALPAEGAVPISDVLWAWVGCFITISLFGLAEAAMAARGAPALCQPGSSLV